MPHTLDMMRVVMASITSTDHWPGDWSRTLPSMSSCAAAGQGGASVRPHPLVAAPLRATLGTQLTSSLALVVLARRESRCCSAIGEVSFPLQLQALCRPSDRHLARPQRGAPPQVNGSRFSVFLQLRMRGGFNSRV